MTGMSWLRGCSPYYEPGCVFIAVRIPYIVRYGNQQIYNDKNEVRKKWKSEVSQANLAVCASWQSPTPTPLPPKKNRGMQSHKPSVG